VVETFLAREGEVLMDTRGIIEAVRFVEEHFHPRGIEEESIGFKDWQLFFDYGWGEEYWGA